MSWFKVIIRFIKWHFIISEYSKVKQSLKLKNIAPYKHPRLMPAPAVLARTRCDLEYFRKFRIEHAPFGISQKVRDRVTQTLRKLVTKNTYEAEFPMSGLHGVCASKSDDYNHPERVSQNTLAAMGALVNDLKCSHLEGDDIINACKAWPELRIDQGIQLITDNWHKRIYWSNSGGSHHMSVLCHELQKQEKEWSPRVKIDKYELDTSVLMDIEGKASIFVIMSDGGLYNRIFDDLPYELQTTDIYNGLGIAFIGRHHSLPLSAYQLILIDHTQKYSDLTYQVLLQLVTEGKGVHFVEFLKAWKNENC